LYSINKNKKRAPLLFLFVSPSLREVYSSLREGDKKRRGALPLAFACKGKSNG